MALRGLDNGRFVLNERGDAVAEPDLMKWGAWMETAERHLALDKLPNGAKVSTVFLGLDHSFDEGVPILWETMIFGGQHDQEQWRYATRDEALKGHKKAVELALSTS